MRPVLHRCGFNGCRVGEASNPGPVQTRSARSTQFDNQGTRAGDTRVVRRTQVDSDSDVPRMRSVGRFSILSTDSEDEVEMGVVQVNPVSDVSHLECDRLAVPVREVETRGSKRQRLSQASTVHVPESVVEALELDLSVASVVAPRPTRRLVLSGGRRDERHDRPEQREHGASSDRSDTESVGVDTHSDSQGSSSFVSEEEEQEVEVPVVAGLPPVRPSVAAQRSGFAQLDRWNVQEVFTRRASVMRTVPRFLWGSFRVALKVALEEVLTGQSRRDVAQQERGWKLFLLLPRMLLHRSPRGGPISRDKLIGRFDQFASGQWHNLLVASQTCAQEAATAFALRKRRNPNDGTRRAARALQFVQWGELSSGRQVSKELN